MRKVLEALELENDGEDEEMDADIPLPLIEPSPVKEKKKKRKSDDMEVSSPDCESYDFLLESNKGRWRGRGTIKESETFERREEGAEERRKEKEKGRKGSGSNYRGRRRGKCVVAERGVKTHLEY